MLMVIDADFVESTTEVAVTVAVPAFPELGGAGSLSGETPTSATYNAPPNSGNAGTATVTATSVVDSTKSASITINITPAPSVTTTSLPGGTQGTTYSQTVATSGGAGTVTLMVSSGSLPAGLSMDSSG